jgi:uncharacterized alkaline shock family protein YloU
MAEVAEKKHEDKIKIAPEVITIIAGIASGEVEGVASMSGGIADGIASMLGKKNLTKGIKVEAGEKETSIEVSIVVQYGCKIHEVAKEVQKKVREAVEWMTGLIVLEVTVNVLGVNIEKEQEDKTVQKNAVT